MDLTRELSRLTLSSSQGTFSRPACVPVSPGVANLLHSESVELGHQIVLPEGRA